MRAVLPLRRSDEVRCRAPNGRRVRGGCSAGRLVSTWNEPRCRGGYPRSVMRGRARGFDRLRSWSGAGHAHACLRIRTVGDGHFSARCATRSFVTRLCGRGQMSPLAASVAEARILRAQDAAAYAKHQDLDPMDSGCLLPRHSTRRCDFNADGNVPLILRRTSRRVSPIDVFVRIPAQAERGCLPTSRLASWPVRLLRERTTESFSAACRSSGCPPPRSSESSRTRETKGSDATIPHSRTRNTPRHKGQRT